MMTWGLHFKDSLAKTLNFFRPLPSRRGPQSPISPSSLWVKVVPGKKL